MVSALHAAGSRRDRRVARPLRQGGLQGAGADGGPAGAGLEPARGARAVLLGRPPLWGLSVDGADGVRMVMDHMRDEMVRAMQLCGAASLKALTPDLVKA